MSDQIDQAPVEAAPQVDQHRNYLDGISDELKSMSNLKDFKDINDLARSYVELDRLRGSSIRIPASDASDEARNEFLNKLKDIDGVLLKSDEKLYEKLGKPENPNQYNLNHLIPEAIAKSVPNLEQDLDIFKHIAYEIGLSNAQAEKVVSARMQALEAATAQEEATREAVRASLKKDWGADFDNRINGVKQVVKIFSERHGPAMQDLLSGPAGNNPALMHILSEMANVYKEGNHAGMSTIQFGITPEQARMKIKEKRADIGFVKAYQDRKHPGHRKAVEELTSLYSLAEGIQQ